MRLAGLLALWLTTTLHADTVRPLPDSLAAMDTIGNPISERLAPGVDYHHRHFSNPFGDGPLSVHYLVIDWRKTAKGFSFAYANCGGKRKRTSRMAKEHQALAAVNGGYHRTKDPTMPYHPMKLDGVVLDSVSPSGGQLALAFDRGRLPVIVPYSKKVLDSYDNVLSGDDATVEKGLKPAKTKEERQKPRAPRTFIGIDPTNEVVVIAVADGRSRRSTGVGFTEECALLLPFGCEKVMNLDGGGSSAMVLRDKEDPSKVHVVNNPSDGIERRVCDALLLLEKTPDAHSGPPSK